MAALMKVIAEQGDGPVDPLAAHTLKILKAIKDTKHSLEEKIATVVIEVGLLRGDHKTLLERVRGAVAKITSRTQLSVSTLRAHREPNAAPRQRVCSKHAKLAVTVGLRTRCGDDHKWGWDGGGIRNGDYCRAAEKGSQALLGGIFDFMTVGTFHAISTAVGEGVVKGASMMTAREATKVVTKVATKEAGRKVAGAVICNVAGRIAVGVAQTVKAGTEGVKGVRRRSKRGEHVINSNLLKLFKNIIE
ncbi:hypothetical protein NDU88_005367 [Pleurodeles waltl]|uniref:Senescence domain-containing protein n=1 Tax=Pleurodeles waltl TaxID=8319 RepID=A0AAV7V5P4_PLEWA|nr:hypothetical protein NDU88_005352 [Pleurodeles waltl]KAJ1196107.1 hypothetical protein NDU88_005367 [Pleurodeles waltl]